jgi:hypothetical protein
MAKKAKLKNQSKSYQNTPLKTVQINWDFLLYLRNLSNISIIEFEGNRIAKNVDEILISKETIPRLDEQNYDEEIIEESVFGKCVFQIREKILDILRQVS